MRETAEAHDAVLVDEFGPQAEPATLQRQWLAWLHEHTRAPQRHPLINDRADQEQAVDRLLADELP